MTRKIPFSVPLIGGGGEHGIHSFTLAGPVEFYLAFFFGPATLLLLGFPLPLVFVAPDLGFKPLLFFLFGLFLFFHFCPNSIQGEENRRQIAFADAIALP